MELTFKYSARSSLSNTFLTCCWPGIGKKTEDSVARACILILSKIIFIRNYRVVKRVAS